MMHSTQLEGTTLGDFRIDALLGRGGMASVFRAKQISLQRDIALKVIHTDDVASDEENFNRRFEKEAAFVSSLEHIHIVPVYAYGVQDSLAYLAMRLISGGSLSDLLKKDGELPLEQALRIFDQVAQGIAHAHAKGIIHRDLKPGNILIDDEGNAYLTDFGLARMVHSEERLTKSDSMIGTGTYMSPEQVRGDPVDHRADIYAMGIVLYEMVCGQLPYHAGDEPSFITVLYKHLEAPPTPPCEVNPDIPKAVETVILRALAKNPDDRFQDIGDMARAIREGTHIKLGSSAQYPAAKPPPTAKQPPQQRNTRLGIGIIGILGLLTVIGLILLSQREQPIPTFSVIQGETILWDALEPTESQIERAQRAIGDDGFVAVFACNRSSEYHATLTREITDRLQGYNIPFQIYDADSDAYTQRLLLEEALTDDASAFIMCPLDYSLLDESLKVIQEAQLPVVSHDNNDNNYGSVITSNENDNTDMGLTVGRFAGEIIQEQYDGQARVIILDFPDLDVIVDRADGLEAGLLEIAPDAEVIGRDRGATQEFACQRPPDKSGGL